MKKCEWYFAGSEWGTTRSPWSRSVKSPASKALSGRFTGFPPAQGLADAKQLGLECRIDQTTGGLDETAAARDRRIAFQFQRHRLVNPLGQRLARGFEQRQIERIDANLDEPALVHMAERGLDLRKDKLRPFRHRLTQYFLRDAERE